VDDATLEPPIERGRRVLAAQAFSVFLGAELIGYDAEGTVLRIPLREEFKQQHGFVHGGLVSYAADNALTYAGGFAFGGRPVVTSEFKINYVRPAAGDALVARATLVYAGRSQAVSRCDVFAERNGSEVLVAVAQGTIVVIDPPAR
jgi:uncharacterized protein (TIGR00369 family)